MQEKRLHLIDTSWSHENEVENGEKTKLQIESAVAHIPECETAEKSCKYMQNYLVPHIILPARY